MTRRNLGNSRLRHRGGRDPMRAYDRLPEPLRQWLSHAALPWSPRSARRSWQRALARHDGCPHRAAAELSALEARLLARDAAEVWGGRYPHPGTQG